MTEVICIGPLPPQGEKWCTMCAIRYKTDAIENPEIRARIEALQHGDAPTVRFDLEREIRLAKADVIAPDMAVAVSVCLQLNGQLVPLCWGHIQGMKFTSVMPAQAGQVPLLTGRK